MSFPERCRGLCLLGPSGRGENMKCTVVGQSAGAPPMMISTSLACVEKNPSKKKYHHRAPGQRTAAPPLEPGVAVVTPQYWKTRGKYLVSSCSLLMPHRQRDRKTKSVNRISAHLSSSMCPPCNSYSRFHTTTLINRRAPSRSLG